MDWWAQTLLTQSQPHFSMLFSICLCDRIWESEDSTALMSCSLSILRWVREEAFRIQMNLSQHKPAVFNTQVPVRTVIYGVPVANLANRARHTSSNRFFHGVMTASLKSVGPGFWLMLVDFLWMCHCHCHCQGEFKFVHQYIGLLSGRAWETDCTKHAPWSSKRQHRSPRHKKKHNTIHRGLQKSSERYLTSVQRDTNSNSGIDAHMGRTEWQRKQQHMSTLSEPWKTQQKSERTRHGKRSTFGADVETLGYLYETHSYSCRLSAFVWIHNTLTCESLHGHHIVSTPFETTAES